MSSTRAVGPGCVAVLCSRPMRVASSASISPKERVLAQARERNVYDHLVKRELTAYLGPTAQRTST